jgi:hypothetical protein
LGTCNLLLREVKEEAQGTIALFFSAEASTRTREQFEEYVHLHLVRRGIPGSVNRRRLFRCLKCGTAIADIVVRRRKERGQNNLRCPVCEEIVSLVDSQHLDGGPSEAAQAMERFADQRRDSEVAQTIILGKQATGDYDIFLCSSEEHMPTVRHIGEQLQERRFLPWFDEWNSRPGLPWQKIGAAAVFVGKGRAPWEDKDLSAILRRFARRRSPIIPVLLPGCDHPPELPSYLEGRNWIDFRQPDPIRRLISAMTDKLSEQDRVGPAGSRYPAP